MQALDSVLVHRDLHEQNVLVNETGDVIAIIDFEEVSLLGCGAASMTNQKCVLGYV